MSRKKTKNNSGFTLIELMVSVTVFSLVMVICMGAIITVLDSNRKSQSIRAVMDNLNYTLEGMTRSIRFGSLYHCDATSGDVSTPTPIDCINGASSIVLKDPSGSVITFKLVGSRIVKTAGGNDYYLTSPDITITRLSFRVEGSSPSDQLQPKVIVVVSGYAGTKENTKSTFSLETTLSQRKIDF